MASQIREELAKLSLNDPVTDYNKLKEDEIKLNQFTPNDFINKSWSKISATARLTVWELLFTATDKEQLQKASELLKLHKTDCCVYGAEDYNKWIVEVRDELLKRNMLEFWQNEIVNKELGICWARDSKLFHDENDPEATRFYNYAECKAPWLDAEKTLKKISKETPLEDFNHNLNAQYYIDEDDVEAYEEIFEETRKMIWQLLFDDCEHGSENLKKAADLLEEYKYVACSFSVLEYNDWIPKVRDELLKRKYFDFWRDVFVKKQLGLIWAAESDYFRDLEDTEHLEFYKVGEDFIKQNKE